MKYIILLALLLSGCDHDCQTSNSTVITIRTLKYNTPTCFFYPTWLSYPVLDRGNQDWFRSKIKDELTRKKVSIVLKAYPSGWYEDKSELGLHDDPIPGRLIRTYQYNIDLLGGDRFQLEPDSIEKLEATDCKNFGKVFDR